MLLDAALGSVGVEVDIGVEVVVDEEVEVADRDVVTVDALVPVLATAAEVGDGVPADVLGATVTVTSGSAFWVPQLAVSNAAAANQTPANRYPRVRDTGTNLPAISTSKSHQLI